MYSPNMREAQQKPKTIFKKNEPKKKNKGKGKNNPILSRIRTVHLSIWPTKIKTITLR